MPVLLSTLFKVFCFILSIAVQGDGTVSTLGNNALGLFGPVKLSTGLPEYNYNVTIYVRVFDKLGAFATYNITPNLQVTFL